VIFKPLTTLKAYLDLYVIYTSQMESTTYFGNLLNSGAFETKVEPTLWNDVNDIVEGTNLEPFVKIRDMYLDFYPEKMQCLKQGKVFSVSKTEHTLKFNHAANIEVGHEKFPSKWKYVYQWKISRKECPQDNGAHIFLDSVENLETGEEFRQIIMKGFSKKCSKLLNEMFRSHRQNSNNR
jgi:hypothetical protein